MYVYGVTVTLTVLGLLFYDRRKHVIFNLRTHLGACQLSYTRKGVGRGGGLGTNKSAQELTQRDRKTVPHPAPPQVKPWVFEKSNTLTTELHPPPARTQRLCAC